MNAIIAGCCFVVLICIAAHFGYITGFNSGLLPPRPAEPEPPNSCICVGIEQFNEVNSKGGKFGRHMTKALYKCSDLSTQNKVWDGWWSIEQLNGAITK